jgi:hypothetical protein
MRDPISGSERIISMKDPFAGSDDNNDGEGRPSHYLPSGLRVENVL